MALRLLPVALAPQSPEAAQDVDALTAAGDVARPVTRAATGTDLAPPAWLSEGGEVWVPGALRWIFAGLRHAPRAVWRRMPR